MAKNRAAASPTSTHGVGTGGVGRGSSTMRVTARRAVPFDLLPGSDLYFVVVGTPYHNKREKLANLLFDLVKYFLTVIGIGAILPGSTVPVLTATVGALIALLVLGVALWVTPEKEEE